MRTCVLCSASTVISHPGSDACVQVNLEARLEALNAQLLAPAGCHAKFGTIFRQHGSGSIDGVEHWLAIATTPEEVAALRVEPAFWRLYPDDFFLTKDGLTLEELLKRTTADPKTPVVSAPPVGNSSHCRYYSGAGNTTRIV